MTKAALFERWNDIVRSVERSLTTAAEKMAVRNPDVALEAALCIRWLFVFLTDEDSFTCPKICVCSSRQGTKNPNFRRRRRLANVFLDVFMLLGLDPSGMSARFPVGYRVTEGLCLTERNPLAQSNPRRCASKAAIRTRRDSASVPTTAKKSCVYLSRAVSQVIDGTRSEVRGLGENKNKAKVRVFRCW